MVKIHYQCSNCGKRFQTSPIPGVPDGMYISGCRVVGDSFYCEDCVKTWAERNGEEFDKQYKDPKGMFVKWWNRTDLNSNICLTVRMHMRSMMPPIQSNTKRWLPGSAGEGIPFRPLLIPGSRNSCRIRWISLYPEARRSRKTDGMPCRVLQSALTIKAAMLLQW